MYNYTHYKPRKKILWVFCFYNNLRVCLFVLSWQVWLYLSWNSIPRGCAWKREASFEKSVLGLGRVMNRDVARMLEQRKSCVRYEGARFLFCMFWILTLPYCVCKLHKLLVCLRFNVCISITVLWVQKYTVCVIVLLK